MSLRSNKLAFVTGASFKSLHVFVSNFCAMSSFISFAGREVHNSISNNRFIKAGKTRGLLMCH